MAPPEMGVGDPMPTPVPSPTSGAKKTNNSNLYLVTFLATLFLLLFVSCGIVLRSYIIRRRYQQQINFALATGALLTPRAQGSKRKRFGMRPRLYENWIAPLWVGVASTFAGHHTHAGSDAVTVQGDSGWEKPSQGRWCDILPLTVQTVIVKRRLKENGSNPNAQSPTITTGVSPMSIFPSPIIGTPSSPIRPLVANINHPSNFLSTNADERTQRRQSRRASVQFADSPHQGQFEFPQDEGRRSRRNSLVSPFAATLRQDDNSAAATPTRERTDSATWRTIIQPNPDLPTPLSASGSATGGPRNLRSALSRLLPVARNNGQDPNGLEMTPTSPGARTLGTPVKPGSKAYRSRTEMLQISVLVAMPSMKTSRLYGDANVVKTGYGSYQSDLHNSPVRDHTRSPKSKRKRRRSTDKHLDQRTDESDEIVEIPGEGGSEDGESESESEEDEDVKREFVVEEDEPPSIPELVLGITRLNYRPPAQVSLPGGDPSVDIEKTGEALPVAPSTSCSVFASPSTIIQ